MDEPILLSAIACGWSSKPTWLVVYILPPAVIVYGRVCMEGDYINHYCIAP